MREKSSFSCFVDVLFGVTGTISLSFLVQRGTVVCQSRVPGSCVFVAHIFVVRVDISCFRMDGGRNVREAYLNAFVWCLRYKMTIARVHCRDGEALFLGCQLVRKKKRARLALVDVINHMLYGHIANKFQYKHRGRKFYHGPDKTCMDLLLCPCVYQYAVFYRTILQVCPACFPKPVALSFSG